MGEKESIRKGISVGQMLFGMAFAAAGVVFIGLAFFKNYTLSIHGFLLPQWVFYLVALLAVFFGAFGVYNSFRVWKCGSCGDVLQYGMAMYPPDQEDRIIEAVDAADPSRLEGIPSFSKGDQWLTLSLDFCTRCGGVALISLTRENRNREKTAVRKPAFISREALPGFLARMTPGVRLDPLKLDG
ncbi:MAG: hypothetical protein JXA20_10790 [Spirochaetes bacterium]|nr:hypothetical protein [Spirochaetota bacterium]